MDRKSITILVVCLLLLFLWPQLVNRLFPPKPVPPSPLGLATNLVESGIPNALDGSNRPVVTPSISMPPSPSPTWVRPAVVEELLSYETPEARYTFTSHGGGLKLIELKEHLDAVPCGRRNRGATNRFARLNAEAPVAAMTLFGGSTLQDDQPFVLQRTAAGIRAEKTLTNGLRLSKDFEARTNHLFQLVVRVENPSKSTVVLPTQEMVLGTATPINRLDTGQYLGVQTFDGSSSTSINEPWFANHFMGCGCLPGTPRTEYLSPGMSNLVWGAVHNQFFTIIAAPEQPPLRLVARRIDLPPPSEEERAAEPKAVLKPFGYQTAFVYPPTSLPAGSVAEWRFEVFAGPKEYNTLARLGKGRDQAMNFPTFFGWFSRALLLSMNGLHRLGLSYGLAIIVITVIVKLLFWPLTQVSTRSMKRMQALQPQMKAIQEKYKDDPKKMNLKLMEFMKENKVSPLGGCLPMAVQIPVFIGFYYMLQSAIELRGARFLWACDLSQPDTILMIAGLGWIPMLGIPGEGFPINPLPLLMGLTQFWQARMTPPSPGVDPIQQKMFQYMPLIFIFVLYNFSSGLALYWTVQNLLSILQMKLTRGIAPAAVKAPVPEPKKRK